MTSTPHDFIEVEVRYKVTNVEALLAHMVEAGFSLTSQSHLVDEWYIPASIHDLSAQNRWFNQQHGVAWRIRRTTTKGSETLEVESKQLTEADDHNTLREQSRDFADYATVVQSMTDAGLRKWLTIDKTRWELAPAKTSSLRYSIDEIGGLAAQVGVGACLEIESDGTSSREEALQVIHDAAMGLGFTDADMFPQSLTTTAFEVLGDFSHVPTSAN